MSRSFFAYARRETSQSFLAQFISIPKKYNFTESASVSDKSDVVDDLGGSKHLGIIFCILLFIITSIVFGLTCYKRLLCFANRRGRWHGTSVVGFTNLSHENGS